MYFQNYRQYISSKWTKLVVRPVITYEMRDWCSNYPSTNGYYFDREIFYDRNAAGGTVHEDIWFQSSKDALMFALKFEIS